MDGLEEGDIGRGPLVSNPSKQVKARWEIPVQRIVRCRGVVPLWDKKWNKSAKDKKADKKPISILPTLARYTSLKEKSNKNTANSDAFHMSSSYLDMSDSDVSGLTSSGRPS